MAGAHSYRHPPLFIIHSSTAALYACRIHLCSFQCPSLLRFCLNYAAQSVEAWIAAGRGHAAEAAEQANMERGDPPPLAPPSAPPTRLPLLACGGALPMAAIGLCRPAGRMQGGNASLPSATLFSWLLPLLRLSQRFGISSWPARSLPGCSRRYCHRFQTALQHSEGLRAAHTPPLVAPGPAGAGDAMASQIFCPTRFVWRFGGNQARPVAGRAGCSADGGRWATAHACAAPSTPSAGPHACGQRAAPHSPADGVVVPSASRPPASALPRLCVLRAGAPVRLLHTMGGDGADAAGGGPAWHICCRGAPATRVRLPPGDRSRSARSVLLLSLFSMLLLLPAVLPAAAAHGWDAAAAWRWSSTCPLWTVLCRCWELWLRSSLLPSLPPPSPAALLPAICGATAC